MLRFQRKHFSFPFPNKSKWSVREKANSSRKIHQRTWAHKKKSHIFLKCLDVLPWVLVWEITKKTPSLEKQNQNLEDSLGFEIQFIFLTLIAIGASERERERENGKNELKERGQEWDIANLLRFEALADLRVKRESLKGERLEVNENEEKSLG